MHKLTLSYSSNRARMTVHLPNCGVKSFVVGKACTYGLLRMETEVCPRARFSHAVWSCLERWRRRRRTSPFVNRTGERILWNLCGALICFSQRTVQHREREREREKERERERERWEVVSTLSDLREPMAGQILPGRRVPQKRWVSDHEQSLCQ